MPHGEVIECTYYYKRIPPPPPPLTALPILAPWLYALVGLLLLGIGSRKLRAR